MSDTKMLVKSDKTKKVSAMTQKELDSLKKANPGFEYTIVKEDATPAEAKAATAGKKDGKPVAASASTNTGVADNSATTA